METSVQNEHCSFISDDEESENDCMNGSNTTTSTFLLGSGTSLPSDKYKFVTITFVLLGLSTLLPWSFFITASDYWMYKFRNCSKPYTPEDLQQKTHLQTNFESWLSISSNVPAFLVLLFAAKLINIPQMYRNGGTLILMIILFILTVSFIYLDTDNWQFGFFLLTMVSVVMINVVGAIFQSGVIGLAALFPKKFIHAMVTGQALGGVFASLAQLLSMSGNDHPETSAFGFFMCAIIGLVITFLCYCAVQKTAIFKFYLDNAGDSDFNSLSESCQNLDNFGFIALSKKVWPCAFCVFLTFTVSMSVFPGLAVLVVSSDPSKNSWTGRFFLPIACFLLFNVGDFCGRLASGFLPFSYDEIGYQTESLSASDNSVNNPKRKDAFIIFFMSIVRVGLLPLFMLCNAHPRAHLPIVFNDDRYFISFISVLGFTNGFLFCSAMLIAPKSIPSGQKERIGSILTIFLLAGLTVGSLLSYPLIQLI